MRIKLAILEADQSYLDRIVSVFSTKYSDKFEVYSFTDKDMAMATLENARIDVLLASEVFELDFGSIPKRCSFAYFVESVGIDTLNEHRAICKFQKAELIYKQILNVYSENAGNVTGVRIDDNSTKLAVFVSPSGGVGTSSMAAACAMYYAAKGKKTLYLNLEKYGSADAFFNAEGQFDMSDIIFSLKSKKANLAMKLESCVKQDSCGVYFYSQSKLALDMLELNADDLFRLINELKSAASYDYIILDMDYSIDNDILDIYRKTHAVVLVGDGSEISNIKLFRAYNALATKEQKKDSPVTNRLFLVYNKFSNKTGNVLDNIDVLNIGGVPRYENITTGQIMSKLSSMDMFGKIF